jgi:hypothetical protein
VGFTEYTDNLLNTNGFQGNDNIYPLTGLGFAYEEDNDSINFRIYKGGNNVPAIGYDVGQSITSASVTSGELISNPSAAPTAAPSSAPVCFSGSSYVQVEDEEDKKGISSIKVGDNVLSFNRNSKVSMT